jgi:hypothetical protein
MIKIVTTIRQRRMSNGKRAVIVDIRPNGYDQASEALKAEAWPFLKVQQELARLKSSRVQNSFFGEAPTNEFGAQVIKNLTNDFLKPRRNKP